MAPSSSPAPMRCAASRLISRPAGCLKLPLFAVGEHTASAARDAGFDAGDRVKGRRRRACAISCWQAVKSKQLKKASHAAVSCRRRSRARSWRANSARSGSTVVTQTTYRMVPVPSLPREVCDAFVAHADRGGAALFTAQRARISGCGAGRAASKYRHWRCRNAAFRAAVAAVLRDAGATQVMVAASPDENALFEALGRALRRRSV